MKKKVLSFAAITAVSLSALYGEVITLDLTKSTTVLEFNADNGSWTGTYDDDAESIDSQCFSFVHSSMGDYATWWGFTASNSCDNVRPENTLTHQWSNMGLGGIVLNEDGTVKVDEYGAPVTNRDVPYLVGFYNSYFSARPTDMAFADGKSYDAVGVYVNLNSYAYYSLEYGDSFARAFTNGDKFTLTIHGVGSNGAEREVEVDLASYSNGNLTINRGWKYVDLTSLDTVNEIYFTLDSTDSGAYGMNTPGYFCLDKLMVSPVEDASVAEVMNTDRIIKYDRKGGVVTLDGADFAIVYDTAGNRIMSCEGNSFSITGLEAGVYIIKSGNDVLKIVR